MCANSSTSQPVVNQQIVEPPNASKRRKSNRGLKGEGKFSHKWLEKGQQIWFSWKWNKASTCTQTHTQTHSYKDALAIGGTGNLRYLLFIAYPWCSMIIKHRNQTRQNGNAISKTILGKIPACYKQNRIILPSTWPEINLSRWKRCEFWMKRCWSVQRKRTWEN